MPVKFTAAIVLHFIYPPSQSVKSIQVPQKNIQAQGLLRPLKSSRIIRKFPVLSFCQRSKPVYCLPHIFRKLFFRRKLSVESKKQGAEPAENNRPQVFVRRPGPGYVSICKFCLLHHIKNPLQVIYRGAQIVLPVAVCILLHIHGPFRRQKGLYHKSGILKCCSGRFIQHNPVPPKKFLPVYSIPHIYIPIQKIRISCRTDYLTVEFCPASRKKMII